MTRSNIIDLKNMDLGKTIENDSLNKYTTYKVGGKAKLIIYPDNLQKLLEKKVATWYNTTNLKGSSFNLLINSRDRFYLVSKLWGIWSKQDF